MEHGYNIIIEAVALKEKYSIEAFPCLGGNIVYYGIIGGSRSV